LHLLGRLRGSGRERWVRVTHERWSPRITRFARFLETLPATAAPTKPEAAASFARSALDYMISCLPDTIDLVDRLELGRLLAGFLGFEYRDDGLFEVDAYALENKLVRGKPDQAPQVTVLGQALLRLYGKDAVRWLLSVEVAQNKGRWDPHHASRELLHAALSASIETLIPDGQRYYPHDRRTLLRLESLGVLTGLSENRDTFDLVESMRDVVEAALADGPWHRAIAAAIEDERTGAFPKLRSGPTEVAVEQTKLVAHEVRNALIPARIRLEALRAAVPEPQVSRVDAVQRGVVRVLTFVDEMVATSELVAEPVTSCELATLVREALSWVDEGERVHVEVASVALRVRAPRTRLARSIANLLRNALQATQVGQAVRITMHLLDDSVRVTVDDAGPGVPDDARERVFQEGYTTRTDGSGYGLAYVRRVVVDGLRGRVWCETSDLGGARFVIELPEVEVEQ
jgi:signal transduction histidine kinase